MNDRNDKSQQTDSQSDEQIQVPENVFLIFAGVKAIPLDRPLMTIGRSHDNLLVLDDPRVSRHHAEIRFVGDHFVIFDLKSSGGTYVNGQRISQGLLYPGDLISLAGINLVFMHDTRPIKSGAEDNGTQIGPGQRPTVVFDSSIYAKKKRGW